MYCGVVFINWILRAYSKIGSFLLILSFILTSFFKFLFNTLTYTIQYIKPCHFAPIKCLTLLPLNSSIRVDPAPVGSGPSVSRWVSFSAPGNVTKTDDTYMDSATTRTSDQWAAAITLPTKIHKTLSTKSSVKLTLQVLWMVVPVQQTIPDWILL